MVRQAAPYEWFYRYLKERAGIVGRISAAPSDNRLLDSPKNVGWRCAYPTYNVVFVRWELGLIKNNITTPLACFAPLREI
ncbi:MAG: hypothetical protein ABW170_09030 [Candidatus Thiodiazotropha sp. L084R]